MKAIFVGAIRDIELFRGPSKIECWRCCRNVFVFGFPYGRNQEPNCKACVQWAVRARDEAAA